MEANPRSVSKGPLPHCGSASRRKIRVHKFVCLLSRWTTNAQRQFGGSNCGRDVLPRCFRRQLASFRRRFLHGFRHAIRFHHGWPEQHAPCRRTAAQRERSLWTLARRLGTVGPRQQLSWRPRGRVQGTAHDCLFERHFAFPKRPDRRLLFGFSFLEFAFGRRQLPFRGRIGTIHDVQFRRAHAGLGHQIGRRAAICLGLMTLELLNLSLRVRAISA